MTPTAASGLAIASPVMQALFADQVFRVGQLTNLALASDPASGFKPTTLALGSDHPAQGTEVLFFPTPESMGPRLAPEVAPLWENGIGLVLYRHRPSSVLGAIFVHGAIKNPWSDIQSGALQALGGIMLFSHDPRENKSAEDLIKDVIRKAVAMTVKWQFIDMNLADNVGHGTLTNLGGGKATASHPAGALGRLNAVIVTAAVASELGIYISGSDQNMTKALCSVFAQLAPRNFMGAEGHPIATYGGMGDPSPWTALGGYESIKVVRRELFGDERVPIFFQGFGNAGAPLVRHLVDDGHRVSGIVERDLEKLAAARRGGITAPLFLEVPEGAPEPSRGELSKYGVRIVRNLAEALGLARGTVIFSPNAGPHPITLEVAEAIINAGIQVVDGITNNVHDLVNGSVEPVVRRLQAGGVLSVNETEVNQMGALSVTVGRLGLSPDQLTRAAQGVGIQTQLMIEAFRRGIPPQIARDRAAARRYNDLQSRGLASGGPFEKTEEA